MQEKLIGRAAGADGANIRAMDPQEMMKLWLAPGVEGFGNLYEAFARMAGGKRE